MGQKEIFLNGEADNYLNRNKDYYQKENNFEEVSDLYKIYGKYIDSSMRVLEIGCCNGINLNYYKQTIGCECHGIDLSEKAIEMGLKQYQGINLSVGSADDLEFPDEYFDVVIFGACLCWVDRALLAKVVSETDRVLKDGGFLGISDFDVKIPRKRRYKHCEDVYTYKCDYVNIFTAFPHYTLVEKLNKKFEDSRYPFIIDTSERFSTNILFKNHEQGYYFEVEND